MRVQRALAVLVGFILPVLAVQAQAAEVKVFCSTALKTVLEEIGPQFEKATGNKLAVTVAPTAGLRAQIDQGAAFDVVLLTASATDDLAKAGKIDPGSRTAIARAGLGAATLKSAPKLDISTSDAFKRTLLGAKSIGMNKQGASSATFNALFEKLGIAAEVKPKVKLLDGAAGEAVAKGEVELGLTQISELLPYAEDQAAPLPADIQTYTTFSGGVSAASQESDASKSLLKFLTAPGAIPVIQAKGMEPG
jgi:molybdate transport system substrate-binding protein